MQISSYPKVWALGHIQIADLLKDPVIVEEKIDGSQISFGVFNGELHIRSKGAVIHPPTNDANFKPSVDHILSIKDGLVDGYIYRGEAIRGQRHNTLTYGRAPNGHVVLFDIMRLDQSHVCYEDKPPIATVLGMECTPLIYEGMIKSPDQVMEFLDRESFLGGPKIEGVVIKNYQRFGPDGKFLCGKYVSEEFKEVHSVRWKESNPGHGDIILQLGKQLKTEARWEKAVQHLRDCGQLDGSPKDIGPLMAEVQKDIHEEEEEWIKQQLFKWGWKKISRLTTSGLPEWWKQKLLAEQFAEAA